jgi:hypothetical protein
MIKALTAIAAAAAIAAVITFSPGFAPEVEAGQPDVTTERLQVPEQATIQATAIDPTCATQSWPHIDASCLRSSAHTTIQRARVVSTDRR